MSAHMETPENRAKTQAKFEEYHEARKPIIEARPIIEPAAPSTEGPRAEIAPRLADDPHRFVPDIAKARAIVEARAAAHPGETPDAPFDLDTQMNALVNATRDEDDDRGEIAQNAIYAEFRRLIARLQEFQRETSALRVDAERWRAFLGSERIKFFGTAGPHGDYAHFGGEFWTRSPWADTETTKRNREFLIQYADAARALATTEEDR